jgi:hypothetical protein
MKTTRNVAIGLLISDWKGLTHVNEFFICPKLNSYLFSVHISSHDFIQVIHAIEFFIIETVNSSRTDQNLCIYIDIDRIRFDTKYNQLHQVKHDQLLLIIFYQLQLFQQFIIA